jgi:predicted lipoprotein
MMGPMRPLLLAAAFLCAGLPSAHAETDHGAIAHAALDNVIRPGYAALTASTGLLKDKAEALCAEPSAAALKDTKEAFAATVESWSKVEIFRFGPVNQAHRYERLFYWPDPKGIGLRQVKAALAKKDETVTLADTLVGKSVALQGLPALEYLLYGDGAETLTRGDPEVGFRCSFASSVATNVDRIARAVAEEWRDGAEYSKLFLSPGPDDPLYRAPKDVTLELYKAFTSGIELVRDQKLGKPLGTSAETARPRLAAFWRSGLTFPNMVGNLDGVRALFAEGGFAGVVAEESPGVEQSVLFDLDRVINVLRAVGQPIAEVVRDPAQRNKLEALRVALKFARDTAAGMIARGAGLSFGFNALDGD